MFMETTMKQGTTKALQPEKEHVKQASFALGAALLSS